MKRALAGALFTGALISAQTAPVVSLRGVVNGITQQPAPSRVSPGGVIWINGLNLGPAEGATASGAPLPTELAGVSVMINNRPAPLVSVSTNRIVAQVPFEVAAALANVVVRRNGAASRPARITVGPTPVIRSANGEGWGEVAAAAGDGAKITIGAGGLTPIDPAQTTGDVLTSDAAPRQPVRVYVGGALAVAAMKPSSTRTGEFDIEIEVPAQAEPGDSVSVVMGNNAGANRLTYQKGGPAKLRYVRIPSGTPALTQLVPSDLNGHYALMNGARGSDGCYPAFRVDLRAGAFTREEGCLVAANQNAPTPFAQVQEGNVIAALEGPAQGQAPAGVSNKLRLFNPDLDKPVSVELPALANNIGGSQNGNVIVRFATDPITAATVDSTTAQVEMTQAAGGGGAVIPGLPGGGGGAFANLQIDLGDGLNKILSLPVQGGQNVYVVVGDDAREPTRAKLAILNQQAAVTGTRDFPEGWLPLMTPAPIVPPNAPPGAGALAVPRAVGVFDGQTQTLFVLGRKPDSSVDSLIGFGATEVRVAEATAGWYFSNCSAQKPVFSSELARRIAFFGARTAEKQARNPCAANGYLSFDLDSRTLEAVQLPGAGDINASGQTGDLADFFWSLGLDPTRPNLADTLFVLDGATGAAFRFDLPAGVAGFNAPQQLGATSSIVATATNRVAGDAGLVIFDMETAASRVFPAPEGFATVQLIGVFPVVRKVLARGNKPNNEGSQLLIYDLISGDLAMPANPEGCAFVGVLPAAAPGGGGGGQPGQGGGQMLVANARSNIVTAGCYSADRQLHGVMSLKIQ